jgi:hypothetical protein
MINETYLSSPFLLSSRSKGAFTAAAAAAATASISALVVVVFMVWCGVGEDGD